MSLHVQQTSSRLATLALAAAAAFTTGSAWAQTALTPQDNEQYRQALYLRETGQPYAAIESLESLLAASPTLNRVRLELAVAYYRTLEFDKAKAQAQKVLDDPKTPEAVRLSVLSFLKKIELEQADLFGKPHRFEPSVSVGVIYDDNVNAGPDTALLPNGLVLTPGSLKQGDWGTVVQAALTHTWARGTPVRMGASDTARFSWVSQLGLYHKAYHDLDQYNLTVLTAATGPALQFQSGHRANLNFQFDHLRLDDETLALFSTITPSFTLRLGKGELSLDGQWSRHSFQRATDRDRTGDYRAVSVSYGHLLRDGRLALQGGVTLFDETAFDDQYANTGAEVFGGARYRAWDGGDLFARASLRRARYDDLAATFSVARRETERRIELGASHRFNGGALDKWQLACTATYISNGANISLYDYQRAIASITLSRSF